MTAKAYCTRGGFPLVWVLACRLAAKAKLGKWIAPLNCATNLGISNWVSLAAKAYLFGLYFCLKSHFTKAMRASDWITTRISYDVPRIRP